MKIDLYSISSILLILNILVLIASGVLVYLYFNPISSLSNTEYIDGDCSGMSLINLSYCLNNELKEFYHYNLSNIGKDLTFEELKDEGGVCHHYTEWYYSRVPDTFYKEKFIIDVADDSAHEFLVISNEEGYCVLDMINIGCVKFGKSNEKIISKIKFEKKNNQFFFKRNKS